MSADEHRDVRRTPPDRHAGVQRIGLDATPARLAAVDVAFQSFNRYLGVAVGEHLSYAWVEEAMENASREIRRRD